MDESSFAPPPLVSVCWHYIIMKLKVVGWKFLPLIVWMDNTEPLHTTSVPCNVGWGWEQDVQYYQYHTLEPWTYPRLGLLMALLGPFWSAKPSLNWFLFWGLRSLPRTSPWRPGGGGQFPPECNTTKGHTNCCQFAFKSPDEMVYCLQTGTRMAIR